MRHLAATTAITLLVGFLGGIGVGMALYAALAGPQSVAQEVQPETCLVATVGLPGPHGGLSSVFGQAELCFREMRWSGVYGPTMPEGGQR